MSSATTIGLSDWVFPEGQVTTNHLSSSIPNGTPYDVHDEKWNTTRVFTMRKEGNTMSTITTSDGTEIFYKDWGSGQPVVFSHGWPLSADDWDIQMMFFLQHGYRVIAHDRRGHGRSTQAATGHDMDHYADDLAATGRVADVHGVVEIEVRGQRR